MGFVVIGHPASVGEKQNIVQPINGRLTERLDSGLPALQFHLVLFIMLFL